MLTWMKSPASLARPASMPVEAARASWCGFNASTRLAATKVSMATCNAQQPSKALQGCQDGFNSP